MRDPCITTDWGAFAENIQGVTDRCRTFKDFLDATRKVINKEINYKSAEKRREVSLENVALSTKNTLRCD